MTFLTDGERDSLTITRMIFHVVGKDLEEPVLLDEIAPPQQADFFLERVRSALRGNLFEFRDQSQTEATLREVAADGTRFADRSKALARDFQSRHRGHVSTGVFFVFELGTGTGTVYALIKYDNDDVVRYVLGNPAAPQLPTLERFRESFVRKAEAMQKIALIRLADNAGGRVAVKDRSNAAHISGYFEGFLQVRRVNSPQDLSGKLVEALKATFKEHRSSLPPDVQASGVNAIYSVLRQPGHRFDPDDMEPLMTAIFGAVPADAPLRRTLQRRLKDAGVSEETFDVDPERIRPPTRRVIETEEGTEIRFDESNRPEVRDRPDGRREIVVTTARVTRNDVDPEPRSRRG